MPLLSKAAPDSADQTIPPSSAKNTYTLYKAAIPLPSGKSTIRVFFWHVNNFPEDLGYAVSAATSDGTSATVSNAVKQVTRDPNGGPCIAGAIMYQTMDAFTPITASLGASEAVIYGGLFPGEDNSPGAIFGGAIQFDITCGAATTLNLRTSASTDTSGTTVNGSFSDDPAWPFQGPDRNRGTQYVKHQRGWWPYSWIVMPITPAFDVEGVLLQQGQPNPQEDVFYFKNLTTAPEMSVSGGYGHQSADTWGTIDGNKGAWGAKLSYDFSLTNNSNVNAPPGQDFSARIWLSTLTGATAPYNGAAFVELSGYGQGIVPVLSPDGTNGAEVELSVDTTLRSDPIVVTPGGQVTARVSVMLGGAGNVPMIIQAINTLDFSNIRGGGN